MSNLNKDQSWILFAFIFLLLLRGRIRLKLKEKQVKQLAEELLTPQEQMKILLVSHVYK